MSKFSVIKIFLCSVMLKNDRNIWQLDQLEQMKSDINYYYYDKRTGASRLGDSVCDRYYYHIERYHYSCQGKSPSLNSPHSSSKTFKTSSKRAKRDREHVISGRNFCRGWGSREFERRFGRKRKRRNRERSICPFRRKTGKSASKTVRRGEER